MVRESAGKLAESAVHGDQKVLFTETHLRKTLIAADYGELEATELAAAWRERHDELIEESLNDWWARGLPPPAVPASRPGRYLTLAHDRYLDRIPEGLPADYAEWVGLVEDVPARAFTLLVAASLTALGCAGVFVIDGANDHGVDCVGVVERWPARGILVLAQAKTSGGLIAQTTVRADTREYEQEFCGSELGAKVAQQFCRDVDGHARIYAFFGGNRFRKSCSQFAVKHGVLLRDSQQIALHLSRSFELTELSAFVSDFESEVRRDLSRDWAKPLRELQDDASADA